MFRSWIELNPFMSLFTHSQRMKQLLLYEFGQTSIVKLELKANPPPPLLLITKREAAVEAAASAPTAVWAKAPLKMTFVRIAAWSLESHTEMRLVRSNPNARLVRAEKLDPDEKIVSAYDTLSKAAWMLIKLCEEGQGHWLSVLIRDNHFLSVYWHQGYYCW